MCYPVCGMMHIKEPLLLIGKSSPCGGSGFRLSLSEWSLSVSLNKTRLVKRVRFVDVAKFRFFCSRIPDTDDACEESFHQV